MQARKRFGVPFHFAQAMTFDELPVGACYAFAPSASRATAKKTGANRALTWPGGTPTVVRSSSLPVRLMSCHLNGLGQMRPPELRGLAWGRKRRKGGR